MKNSIYENSYFAVALELLIEKYGVEAVFYTAAIDLRGRRKRNQPFHQ